MCDIYLEKIRLYEISTALDYEKIEKLKDIINKLNKEIAELKQNSIIKSTESATIKCNTINDAMPYCSP